MKKITLLFFLFSISVSFAQKSAPVMGDIITLLDLYKKDYNLSLETKNENVALDRAKAVLIFKSYLDDPAILDNTKVVGNYDFQKDLEIIQKQETALKTYLSQGTMEAKGAELAALLKEVEKYEDGINTAKNKYYTNLYTSDNEQLVQIKQLYSTSNTYLAEVVQQFITKYNNIQSKNFDNTTTRNTSVSINKGFPLAGGLDAKLVVDALAKFIADGIKKELTVYAIEKVTKYVNEPTPSNFSEEFVILLPKTTEYFKSFNADQLVNINDQLKQQIENDLNDILKNIGNLKETTRIKKLLKDNPELEFAFEGLELLPRLKQIENPIEYFEILENSPTLQGWAKESSVVKLETYNAIRFMTMMAYSLTLFENNEQKFVNLNVLQKYVDEREFYLLYVGLLRQQNEKYYNIVINKQELKTVLNTLMTINAPVDKIDEINKRKKIIKESLTSIVQNAYEIYNLAQDLKKQNIENKDLTAQQVYDFAEALLAFTEKTANSIDKLKKAELLGFADSSDSSDITKKLKPYIACAHLGNSIILNLQKKNYAFALNQAIEIYQTIGIAVGKPEPEAGPEKGSVIRLIGFVSEMALSKDSEGVETAIKNYADAAGTSSLKENSKSNFSISAYPGLLGGLEYTDTSNKDYNNAGFIGFTAPVGLYCHLGSSPKGTSWGLFIPIIDIAAPVRVRLDSTRDTEALPDFDWGDIFSPGLYLSMGIGNKIPLAINLGIQYGPKLRDIPVPVEGVEPTTKLTSADSFRVGLGAVIDIPIFTIHNRAKEYVAPKSPKPAVTETPTKDGKQNADTPKTDNTNQKTL